MTERLLSRRGASEYLKEQHGLERSPQYLAKLAVTGGGPAFRKRGATVIYSPSDLDAYVQEITSPPVRSTSELRRVAAPEAA